MFCSYYYHINLVSLTVWLYWNMTLSSSMFTSRARNRSFMGIDFPAVSIIYLSSSSTMGVLMQLLDCVQAQN